MLFLKEFLLKFIFFSLYECFAHMYVFVPRACLVPTEKSEKASDTLVLESWMLVNLRVSGCWELNPGPELNKWPLLLGISAAPALVFDWELRSNLWKLTTW